MLRIFHAMKSVYAHPVLPQSDSCSSRGEIVHLGYFIVLMVLDQKEVPKERARSLIMHVLIPALAKSWVNELFGQRQPASGTHPVVMNTSITSEAPIVE